MSKVYTQSLADGITIGLGYLPVAMAFGITAKPLLDLLSAGLMSALNFAGAGQFLTLQMLNNSSYIAIIIAVFILNSRMFIMSFKINYDLKHLDFFKRFLISMFVTDESFAVTSRYPEERKTFIDYFVTLFISYVFWIVFTVVGYLTGEVMSDTLVVASGIALYALFIALLMPSVRDYKNLVVAGLGMGMHFLFKEIGLASGIAIVLAMLGAAWIGLFLDLKDKNWRSVS
ncbi:AzlC family ABC transporter permease [Phocicoccus pinnipedialis]|uniref:Inner membrane protein YgaZ n=1 Tax=Phocicoccus pinnipedialis TaxID=110845 RepID=A0A6V7R4W7_9BACL|nr:AzlC family ABC transporter permease [Jeotgalicoccus pinnipedialis]MBP1939968.1 putative branched-subunit amino acid permease [Jeotgalicoccus pinnipedialis]CAD2072084.1 hypothetical protein JEOPIN946_00282 [Jeotgalicoccus pinnipedialis]